MEDSFSLIVCGSRNFKNKEFLFKKLDFLLKNKKNITIIEGGQKSYDRYLEIEYGADYFAKVYAEQRGYKHIQEKAKWDEFGKAAGMIRNGEMIKKYNPNACVGFFDKDSKNRGTTDMVNKATKKGLLIRKYII